MSKIKSVYFIGIGGIGMSAIARYYNHIGCSVAGYDRVSTVLTRKLESEGISIHYEDNIDAIPAEFLVKEETLVIYTPAVPINHSELCYFADNNFNLIKRSKALGTLTANSKLMAVAGTHGKTSTSTLLAWLAYGSLKISDGVYGGGSAFLGGISKNFGNNVVLGSGDVMIVEADEFDRSFLQLHPQIALISSTDADHLDIYGTHEAMKESFNEFASQVKRGGVVISKKGVDITPIDGVSYFSYSLDDPSTDFYATNIELKEDALYRFDIVTPERVIKGCELGIPALVNVENCIGAVAMLTRIGCDEQLLKEAISSYRGVKRRFELHVNRPNRVYIDDYAHHPRELSTTITSIKSMFPNKKITAIFQPHLFSRTNDFAVEFAESLSLVDRVLLLPIYPARELPIEGVTSQIILNGITIENKQIVGKDLLIDAISGDTNEVIVTFGAGDIDLFVPKIIDLFDE